MISPHFPPDTSAASHRVRLLAPYLEENGWLPTVLTLSEDSYEARLDRGLEQLVPRTLRVERCRAWPASVTRKAGFGDLGLRSMTSLRRAAHELMTADEYSALFITIYPSYPALLGPGLKKRFHVPFVLDYQDPWVGAWGDTVGGGAQAQPDVRSRLTRRLALTLEPRAVRAADAITAVSSLTYENVAARIPHASRIPSAVIPLGGEPRDFEFLRTHPRKNLYFDRADGCFHLCYTGALLPLGVETLRGFLKALRIVRETHAETYSRLRVHFFGTSNQTVGAIGARVMPHADEIGVSDIISEHPARIDYFDALKVQMDASAIVLLGSSERHYTASKLYPALLAGPPVIALFHEASSVTSIINELARPDVRLVTYDDSHPVAGRIDAIAAMLLELMERQREAVEPVGTDRLGGWAAPTLAARLARVFDSVA
jgi:hypothetical protein